MKKVFILTRNGQVEMASKDVKILWKIMTSLLSALGQPAPESYVTITRHINQHGTFVHCWAPGQSFEIITRDLLFTRRASRKKLEENAREELAQHINK